MDGKDNQFADAVGSTGRRELITGTLMRNRALHVADDAAFWSQITMLKTWLGQACNIK
jgi:hypothetical protein